MDNTRKKLYINTTNKCTTDISSIEEKYDNLTNHISFKFENVNMVVRNSASTINSNIENTYNSILDEQNKQFDRIIKKINHKIEKTTEMVLLYSIILIILHIGIIVFMLIGFNNANNKINELSTKIMQEDSMIGGTNSNESQIKELEK